MHPIEPATNFGLIQATTRLLARGVDFSWKDMGILVLDQPRALATLRLAGWKDEALWVERADVAQQMQGAELSGM